jgi:hypothetical protein
MLKRRDREMPPNGARCPEATDEAYEKKLSGEMPISAPGALEYVLLHH